MIKFLQSGNKAAKYILGGFLLILAASMVTYLIPGFSDTTLSRTGVVATVGGQEIRNEEVTKVLQQMSRGRQIPDQYMPIFRQRAVEQLVQQAEIAYEAERMGLKVSDQEVRDELQNGVNKAYFFPDGKWIGADKYTALLLQIGKTVPEFEHDVRRDLLQQKLFTAINASASVPDSVVEAAYKERNIKVKFQYAILNLDDIKKGIKPTDAELKSYFDMSKSSPGNLIPEKRQIRYFMLQDKDAEDKVIVDAADLQRYYTEHQDAYRVPERVRVRHILVSAPGAGPDGKVDQKAVDAARAKAQDILKQVKAGGDFAALAKKYSEDKGGNPGSAEVGGETIAAPLEKSKVFPPMVISMISVGESTGGLDEMLSKIADFYDEEVDVAVGALLSLMEPIMIVVLGVVVGGMVVAMYLPIFKLGGAV